jgi:YD repeat-containing protein
LQQSGETRFERDANGQVVRQDSAERDDRYEWDASANSGASNTAMVQRRASAMTLSDGASSNNTSLPLQGRCLRPEAHPTSARGAPNILGGRRLARRGTCDNRITEYATWRQLTHALWEDGKLLHVVHSQLGVPPGSYSTSKASSPDKEPLTIGQAHRRDGADGMPAAASRATRR